MKTVTQMSAINSVLIQRLCEICIAINHEQTRFCLRGQLMFFTKSKGKRAACSFLNIKLSKDENVNYFQFEKNMCF